MTLTKLLAFLALVAVLALAWLGLARFDHDSVAEVRATSWVLEPAQSTPPAPTLEDPSSSPEARSGITTREVSDPSTSAPLTGAACVATWHRLAVRVLDARTREPIAGGKIEFVQSDRSTGWYTTDGEGRIDTNPVFVSGYVDVRLPPEALGVGVGLAAIEPSRFWIDASAGPSQLVRVELLATRLIAIDVTVQQDDGTPAPRTMISVSLDADLALVSGRAERNELTTSFSTWSDESGRCRLWISPRSGEVCRLAVCAFSTGGMGTSETLEPPLRPTAITLVLDRGSSLRVRVADPRAAPVAGAKVELMTRAMPAHTFVFAETTTEDGVAVFHELPSDRFDVAVSHESSRRSTEQAFELTRGEHAALEIVLPDSPERLAVRGRVLDEQDEPLANVDVRVEAPRGATNVQSDRDGAFEVWMTPSEALTVEVGSTALADLFEPQRAAVPFGTTDFVARRAHVVERTRLLIQIVGADTRNPIENASIHMAVRPGASFSSARVNKGWASVNVTDRPGACVLFSAPGYKSVLRPSRELLPPLARPDDITIELEPGFERRLTFVDSETAQPLAGVSVTDPSGAVVRSDAQGNVFLSAPEWPTEFRIEHDGYFPFEWDPSACQVWQRVFRVEKMPR